MTEYQRKYAAWTEKGVEAFLSTRESQLTLFGGAKGGSKTVTGCRIYQTDISNYRDGVFVVLRKNFSTLHGTTKQTFERFFPPDLIVSKSQSIWHCVNGNQIWWHAADRSNDPDYEKTRGIEASALFPDEASQFDEAFYEIMPSLLRRPAIHIDTGRPLRGYIYLTSNPVPGMNWLKRHFIDPKTRKTRGHQFIQSLPDDNPLLPEGYIENAFGTMSEAMLRMLRFGDWDVDESELKIVPADQLSRVALKRVHDRNPVVAGIDIGLGRPDKTVVYCGNEQGEIWREDAFEEYDTMEQVKRLRPIVEAIDGVRGRVYIDSGSVGKGVADRLFELYGVTVVSVLFGSSASEELIKTTHVSYENRRAQLYSWAREDSAEESFKVEVNDELEEELANTFYLPLDGKLMLEPKKLIRERIGRSPDDADGFVLCNAARRDRIGRTLIMPRSNATARAARRSSRSDATEAYM